MFNKNEKGFFMTNKKISHKDGYQPESNGYKPTSQPSSSEMPNHGRPGAGYQPTSSQGGSPTTPPKKP
jgi:hypothetical protein